MNILYVCTYNQIRSRTAEAIYRKHPGLQVRSAGISSEVGHKINQQDIEWADLIIVMEARHRDYIRGNFDASKLPSIEVLDFATTLPYNHPQLVEELTELIDPILRQAQDDPLV